MRTIFRGYGVYKWNTHNNVQWIGNIDQYQDLTDIMYRLSRIDNVNMLKDVLKEVKGSFSFVILIDEKYYLCTDIAKSFPLFFDTLHGLISDSTEAMVGINNNQINDMNFGAILTSSYTLKGKTIYENICQVSAGEIVVLDNTRIERTQYYRHLISSPNDCSIDELRVEFDNVLDCVFDDLIQSLHNKCVVLPLSGGYDSRLIAAALKKRGYTNVICYTYGIEKSGNEVQFSREVAKQLGFNWIFIEYTEHKWKQIINSDVINQYGDYASNGIVQPHLQELIALEELKNNRLIPEDSVFIPGFSADLPAGSFIRPEVLDIESLQGLTEYIYKYHYKQVKLDNKIEIDIKDDILKQLSETDLLASKETIIKLNDYWVTMNRVSQYIINALRIYDFFGFEWRIPFWDMRFLNFFYSLDSEKRVECNFYINYLFDGLFKEFSVDFRKPKIAIVRKKNDSSVKKILLKAYDVFSTIAYVKIGITTNPRHNINNYNYLSRILYEQLSNKHIMNTSFKGVMQMISLWWCEKKYGPQQILKVEK